MPVLPMVRLPLPNLRTYAIVSSILFLAAVFHATNWSDDDQASSHENTGYKFFDIFLVPTGGQEAHLKDKVCLFLRTMAKEPWCFMVLINQACCCLMLFGKIIQRLVFGQLRVVEQQHVKDKFWNFVFYKFIYIFGVMNVQEVEEIILWLSWFSVLGFLHILSTLSKDRFEYNSSSPSVTRRAHWKVLSLLAYLHITSWSLLVLSVYFSMHYVSINTFAFMLAESLMLAINTLYVLVRYGIHLKDAAHEGAWENRAILVYYSDFVFEVSALLIDFLHHLHMLLYGNIFLSMASLVIGLQLKQLYYELKRRIKRHENYRRVVCSMETKFPIATSVELKENDDDCAICWEKMDAARKLPCGHVFHNTCLRSWLEQDTTCPTCRLNLRELQRSPTTTDRNMPGVVGGHNDLLRRSSNQGIGIGDGVGRIGPTSPIGPQNRRVSANGRRTSYFHFDGSRILSWLPSFSVEVTQSNLLGGMFGQTSTIDNMVRQVREIFPNYPASVVRDDIRVTRSIELTIDNIVEGRLVIPEGLNERDEMSGTTSIPASTFSDDPEVTEEGRDVELDRMPGTSDTDPSSNPQQDELIYDPGYEDEDDASRTETDGRYRSSNVGNGMEPVWPERLSDAPTNDHALSMSADECPESQDGQVADGIGMGFRFSKSSVEREKMLLLRKKKLVDEARRIFLLKNNLAPLTHKNLKRGNSSGQSQDANTMGSRQDRLESSNQTQENSSPSNHNFRRRFFSRSRTEGSPVDVVQSSRNGFFGFINQ